LKLSDVGERGFVSRALELLSGLWVPGLLRAGDDASSYYAGGLWILFKIDGFSAYSSRYPWNSLGDLGWKAATSCASDIAAKGGSPRFYMISIGAPGDLPLDGAMDIMRGFKEAIELYGGFFAGGDTNSSREDIWIDVACVGYTSSDPIPRSGYPGDDIVITGSFGYSGLARVYYEKLVRGELRVEDIPVEVVRATSRPVARVGAAEVLRRYRGCIRGSVDVSDSLAESLYIVSEASGYEVELWEIPADPSAIEIAGDIGADALDVVFNGGEEYELVLAVDRGCSGSLVEELRGRGIPAGVYGVISGRRGVGVLYRGARIPRAGYQHFKSI